MAEGKNIEIKIAATGGDQAAAEVRKVEDAAKSVTEATQETGNGSTGFGGMLDALPEKAEAATEKVEDLDEMVNKLVEDMGKVSEETEDFGKKAEELGKKTEEAGKKSDNAGPKLDKIANIQRAEVAAALAEGLGKIGESIRATAEDFAAADPQMSKTLTGVADGLDTMSSAANLAAQGFAVGGPFGAAIGALVGAALPELKSSLDGMVESLKAAANAEREAAVAKANLNAIYAMGVDAYYDAVDAAQAYEDKTKELTETIDAQTAAMEKRNRVNRAKDSADAAERDVADAQAIRDGAAPEDVKAKRALDDAEVAKRAVAEDLELKRLAQTSAADKLLQSNRNVEAVQNDPTITNKEREKKLEEEKRKRDAAQKAFDSAQNEFEASRDVAEQKTREIDAVTTGKVDGLVDQKAQREKREQEAAERKAQAADDKKKREEEQAENKREAEEKRRRSETLGSAKDALGLAGDIDRPGVKKALEDRANAALKDPSAKNQGELESILERLLDTMEANAGAHTGDDKYKKIMQRLGVLEGQIKNRGGR